MDSDTLEEVNASAAHLRARAADVGRLDAERVRLAGLKVTALERAQAAAGRALRAAIGDRDDMAADFLRDVGR